MMQKKAALLLAGCLLFVGCGSPASSAVSSSAEPSSSAASSQEPSSGEPVAAWQQGYLPQFAAPEVGTPIVTLHTTMGDIKMMLFPQAAPKTVESFVTHCKDGYYDGVIFHRVIEDFMIQGGDPLGTGTGGESAFGAPLPDEFSDNLYNFRGAVSMANAGYGTSGSQFFIVQEDAAQYPDSGYRVTAENADKVLLNYMLPNSEIYQGTMKMNEKAASGAASEEMKAYVDVLNAEIQKKLEEGITEQVRARFGAALEKYIEVGGTPTLDYKHTVFGQVIEGMDVVDAIARVQTGTGDKPVTDVVINSTTVETAK